MKLKPESQDIDLYVSPKRMTAKERKELGEFIEEYKRKKALKKKHRKLHRGSRELVTDNQGNA